jgi:hypothetical protein
VLSKSLRVALKQGLPLRFSSDQAATARFALTAGKTKLASVTKLVGAGRRSIRVRLKHRPHGAVTVKMTLISAAGVSRSYSTKVTLR